MATNETVPTICYVSILTLEKSVLSYISHNNRTKFLHLPSVSPTWAVFLEEYNKLSSFWFQENLKYTKKIYIEKEKKKWGKKTVRCGYVLSCNQTLAK